MKTDKAVNENQKQARIVTEEAKVLFGLQGTCLGVPPGPRLCPGPKTEIHL